MRIEHMLADFPNVEDWEAFDFSEIDLPVSIQGDPMQIAWLKQALARAKAMGQGESESRLWQVRFAMTATSIESFALPRKHMSNASIKIISVKLL